jgi:hypothetical protein
MVFRKNNGLSAQTPPARRLKSSFCQYYSRRQGSHRLLSGSEIRTPAATDV